MHPCYDNFQKVLKDNMTIDVFKSIVVSLDEIIELKVAIKIDDKFTTLLDVDKVFSEDETMDVKESTFEEVSEEAYDFSSIRIS